MSKKSEWRFGLGFPLIETSKIDNIELMPGVNRVYKQIYENKSLIFISDINYS